MTNIKKLSYFIILFAMSNMVQGGNYNKASLELNGIEDGKTYSSPIKIDFIVKNMKVVKAGVNEKNSGHHHLLLNLDEMPNLKMPLPMTENILHYGKGQTSTTLELSPGKHTIQLLFADYSHTPHNPPLMTKKITIFIK
jgi:hypothetical protein|tara:strand:+ start:15231 stop:15647 length:417 start_codon:yes stop_codon:yes gene_type:complete